MACFKKTARRYKDATVKRQMTIVHYSRSTLHKSLTSLSPLFIFSFSKNTSILSSLTQKKIISGSRTKSFNNTNKS